MRYSNIHHLVFSRVLRNVVKTDLVVNDMVNVTQNHVSYVIGRFRRKVPILSFSLPEPPVFSHAQGLFVLDLL